VRHRHMISTVATKTRCGRCRHPILAALDQGLPARVELTALDRNDEIAALLAGLHTYTYTANHELVERSTERIASGRPVGTIHAQHQCPTPSGER